MGMLRRYGGPCCRTRGFLFLSTFLLAKFLLLLASSTIIEVEAVTEERSIEKFNDTSYKGNEYWQRKGDGMNYFASAVDSKLEKVKVNVNQVVKSESWWRERPSKEDVGFIWEVDKEKSKRRARKKKKLIVKTHDHKFAILHKDL